MARRRRVAVEPPPELSGFAERLRSLVSVTTQAKFATAAGVSQAWLSELLAGGEPSMTTLIALAKAGRVSVQWLATGQPVPVPASLGGGIPYGDTGLVTPGDSPIGHFAEREAAPYEFEEKTDLDRALAAFASGHVADVWELKTNAVEMAGYLPGDIVVVAADVEPQPGDLVLARPHAAHGQFVEAVWRLYAPPALVTATSDRAAFASVRLDQASVMGVVIGSFRRRRPS
jgi:transcriptional regulator with XRE-family HTH domain